MSRVKDFNLLKVADVSSSSTNTNSVSVVVNADTSGKSQNNNNDVNFTTAQTPTQTLFPSVITTQEPGTVEYGSQSNQQVQQLQARLDEMDGELRFYKLLSSTLSNLLANDDPKLLINLIDQSGKIIIEAQTLIELTAIKTNTDKNLVNIQFRDEEPTCFAKINPIKEISNIKINDETFSLKYNKAYNILQDTFNISLNRCIIPEIPLDRGITYRRP